MSNKIGIIGTGYVGLVSGTTFAAMGNTVWCVDIDPDKLNKMRQGICPIFEPGLDVLMKQGIDAGKLFFTDDLEKTIIDSKIVFLCLPTPPMEDGSADLHHVMDCAKDIANILKKNNITEEKIIVDKSTVPVGTSDHVLSIFDDILGKGHKVDICSNPEFLREGFAVEDAMKPERVVVGTSSKRVEEFMSKLYKPFLLSGNPVVFMDEKSAEITKYAANAFLSIKISYMNELARYCEVAGADIDKIRRGIGSDSRIGKRFLFAGIGYGGSCFPKDVKAIAFSSAEAGTPLQLVEAARRVNDAQPLFVFDKIKKAFGGDLKGKTVAVWGLAFKPNTDDTREAPAFILINELLAAGAKVKASDPEAIENSKIIFGDKIEYFKAANDCLDNADCLVLVTEWTHFRNPDWNIVGEKLNRKLIFDGRNIYSIKEMEEHGFEYHCIGRKSLTK